MRHWILPVMLIAGCQEYSLDTAAKYPPDAIPDILVDPLVLNYWAVDAGSVSTLSTSISNVGAAPLTVNDLVLAGSDAFALAQEPSAALLEPGSSIMVEVEFSPVEPSDHEGTLTVFSDDPDSPEIVVDLLGSGLGPWLEITPEFYDFGDLPIQCGESIELTLQNTGTANLTVSDLESVGPGFTLESGPTTPFLLAPGSFTTAWVDFTPVSSASATGYLNATANDPRGVVSAEQAGRGTNSGTGSEQFTAPTNPPVDILFAIDQSCSMDDDATNLGANFQTFINEINTITAGWHIGVVTLDSGCINSGVLTPNTPDVETVFQDAVVLGEDREVFNDESLFQLVHRALDQTGSGECNAGFLRAGAPLHVIYVSDEPERSWEQAAAWTWDYWLPQIESAVSNPALLTQSGILDIASCNEGASGYTEMIQATGGDLLDICAPDWSTYVSTLAATSVQLAWTFPLSEAIDPNSLEVIVDGQTISGWSYDASLNAVIVDTLLPGSTVDISYSTLAECP